MNHRSLKLRITTIIAVLSFFTLTLTATGAFAQPNSQAPHSADSFVQGTDGSGNTFSGVVKITNFAVQGNQLIAQGLLNGTLTKADGTVESIAGQAVNFAVSGVDPNCQILNLVLGPLDVNLLGLTIHLNQVVLNITAVPGAGNLLGNLLCDVSNLLNTPGQTLAETLNRILSILIGL